MEVTIKKDNGEVITYNFTKRHQEQFEGDGIILALKDGEGLEKRAICYSAADYRTVEKDRMPEIGDTLELDGEVWVYEEKMSRQYWDELIKQGAKIVNRLK